MLQRGLLGRCCCTEEGLADCGFCTCKSLLDMVAPKSGDMPCCIKGTISGVVAPTESPPCDEECVLLNGTHIFAWDEDNLYSEEDECVWYKYICCWKDRPSGFSSSGWGRATCECFTSVATVKLTCSGTECTVTLAVGATFTSDPIQVDKCSDLVGPTFDLIPTSGVDGDCDFSQAAATIIFQSQSPQLCVPTPCKDLSPCWACGDGEDCTKQITAMIIEVPADMFRAVKPWGEGERWGGIARSGFPSAENWATGGCEDYPYHEPSPCRCVDDQCLQGVTVVIPLGIYGVHGNLWGSCHGTIDFRSTELCPHPSDGQLGGEPYNEGAITDIFFPDGYDLTGLYAPCCARVSGGLNKIHDPVSCEIEVSIAFSVPNPYYGVLQPYSSGIIFKGESPLLPNGNCDCSAGPIQLKHTQGTAAEAYSDNTNVLSHSKEGLCCRCINKTDYSQPPWNMDPGPNRDWESNKERCIGWDEDGTAPSDWGHWDPYSYGTRPHGHKGGCNVHNGLDKELSVTLVAGCLPYATPQL